MSEPTAEQIEAEVELATRIVAGCVTKWSLATALARLRKEAHAAGRDEGLVDGFAVAEYNAEISTWDGWQTTAPTIEWRDARKKLDAIRALRGRT